MERALWRQAEEIFHQALERSPEERRTFLDEACSDDAGLRELVETLVSKDQQAGSFLGMPLVAEGPRAADTRGSLVGRQYGPYRFVAFLGAGGMGEVYRAHDTRLDRDVAIKTLPPEFARDPGRLTRLEREARTLASLNHPNIGAIYGLEESPDAHFLVLELVEGETLRGPLSLGTALDRACQVAEALEAAHDHAIVHRDLKPANLKVTPQGRVKVLDFGLAKAMWGTDETRDLAQTEAELRSSTVTGHVAGTPGYMSPEQACGGAVDQRTDIWAFGCLLYELLSGRRAFEGETVSAAIGAVMEHGPDWQALPADTPAEVRDLLCQCLRKDADRRPSRIADVRATLEAVLDREGPRRRTGPPVAPTPERGSVSALMPRLAAERPATPVTPYAGSVDAYELCLRARYHHQRRTPEGFGMALRLFEQAVARDPHCAMAHAGVAHVCLLACYFGGLPTREGMTRMKTAAIRAVELDDTLAVAHVRMGDALCFKDWDWAGSEREFRRALELDPESPEALCRYGLFLWARLRNAEALVQLRKSLELDPFSLDTLWLLGWVYISLRQLDEAWEAATKIIAMDANTWLGYHIRAIVNSENGRWAEAVQDGETMAAIEGGPMSLSSLCSFYARAGRLAEARQALDRLEQMKTTRIVPPTWLALACDAVGADEQARLCMQRAFAERHMLLVHLRGWMTSVGFLSGHRALLDEYDL